MITNPWFDNLHAYNGMEHNPNTTSIRNIIYSSFADEDLLNPLNGYRSMEDVIQRGRELVFDFDYGIINTTFENDIVGKINLKDSFETAFITKFMLDEIGYESFVAFKSKLYGKLLEITPMLNAKFNLMMKLRYKDFYGGYDYNEHIDNVHHDDDTGSTTGKNKGKAIGNTYPVNVVNALDELGDINYASDGTATENDSTNTRDLHNTGGYTTDRTVERDNRNLIDNMLKLKSMLNDIISSALNECGYLFMGII